MRRILKLLKDCLRLSKIANYGVKYELQEINFHGFSDTDCAGPIEDIEK